MFKFQIHNLYNPYSAEIDFRRQNITSTDVEIWRQKRGIRKS